MKFKKGDIVKFTDNLCKGERFYIFSDPTDDTEVTLIKYSDENFMTSGWIDLLEIDIEFNRKLKINKIYDRIKSKVQKR